MLSVEQSTLDHSFVRENVVIIIIIRYWLTNLTSLESVPVLQQQLDHLLSRSKCSMSFDSTRSNGGISKVLFGWNGLASIVVALLVNLLKIYMYNKAAIILFRLILIFQHLIRPVRDSVRICLLLSHVFHVHTFTTQV